MPHISTRRTFAILPVAVATAIASRAANAQLQTQTVALAAGPTMPRGAFADSVNAGYHVTGSLGFHFGERFTLRGEAMYQRLSRKVSPEPRDNEIVGFSGGAEIELFGIGGPYLVGGYGFYQTLKAGSVPASAWRRGYSFGGGWRVSFSRFSLFGEVRLHRMSGEQVPEMVPISFGIRI